MAWPLIQPLAAGGSISEPITAASQEMARVGGLLPSLWIGSILLYLIAAALTAVRAGAAPGAYFLGFGSEVIQRVLLQWTPEASITDTLARVAAALATLKIGMEPGPASLAALFAVGLLVVMTGTWRGQNGQALTRHWTQPPVYA
ncbi:hypothetical protein [Brevundimonas sp. AAP58]|uniref:hypothetical protein n=1 Tax=Brevundimonas sp. AAP58 TaxID=1523422 RepID=UPI0012E1FDBC|nr:hypothetical protein [Brevundimonas sp. AAP58]